MPDEQPVADNPTLTRPRLARYRRAGAWLLVSAALYSAAGFLLLPWLIARELPGRASALLDTPVAVEQVRFNPWSLTASLEGLAVTGDDGQLLLGLGRLSANLELASLAYRALVFDELTLDELFVRVARDASGRMELLERIARALGDDESTGAEAGTQPLRLVIRRFGLTGGSVLVEDRVPTTPFTARIEPLEIQLADISTLPDGQGRQQVALTVGQDVRLAWSGEIHLNPFFSAGEVIATGPYLGLAARYFTDELDFLVEGGRVALRLDHRIELAPTGGGLLASISNGEVTFSDLVLRQDGQEPAFATLPAVNLTGLAVRWPEKVASAGRLSIDSASLRVTRLADGMLDLATLPGAAASPLPEPDAGIADAPDAAGAAGDNDGGWQVRLGELRLSGLSADLEDQVPATAARLGLRDLQFSLRDFDSAASEPLPFDLATTVAAGGRITADGTLGPLPTPALDAALVISGLSLSPAQAYLAELLRVRLDDGNFSGRLAVSAADAGTLNVRGSAEINRLAVSDPATGEALVAWQRLAIEDFVFNQSTNALEVSTLRFEQPFVRLVITESGDTNLGLLRGAPENGTTGDAAGSPAASEALDLVITRVSVIDGSTDFTDLALPFPFRALVTGLGGEIGVLSTRSSEPARISLEGQVAEYGLARVSGAITLADPTARSNLDVSFRNVALPDLSPYLVKFAGRRIDDGRLNLDLRYRVEDGQLQGDNQLVIERLRLGAAEDYPGSTNLPLGLAVALLRGPDGTINIDLPVSGDINNPSFSIGRVITRAFVNLVTRVASAPFRLLGRLVGSDTEDFGTIAFEPGSARLLPPEREKLVQLGEALALRPALAIEVPAVSADDADRSALREQQLDTALQARLAEGGEPGRIEQQRVALESLFVERFPDADLDLLRGGYESPDDPEQPDGATRLDVPAWLAALRARLVETEAVTEDALDALARSREAAIVDWLLTSSPALAGRVRPAAVVRVQPSRDGTIPLALEASTDETGADVD